MAKTALELTEEERKQYRPLAAIQERHLRTARQQQQRWQAARAVADRAATLLRAEYGATIVLLFGSATEPSAFTDRSDIDLAAVGIPADRFFQAVAAVTALSADFQIDLVDLQNCPAGLRAAVEHEGLEL